MVGKNNLDRSIGLESIFLEEKNRLKNIIYDEIELLEKKEATDIKCSITVLKDILFVIDRGFEDILSGLNEHNLKYKEDKLHEFKDSLVYTIYK